MNVTVAQFQSLTGINVVAGNYKLHVTNNGAYDVNGVWNSTSNYIWWDWPSGMDTALHNGLQVNFVVIQKSTSASNLPNAGVVYRPGRSTVPVDANWTTVKQWDNASFVLAGWPNGDYTDPFTGNGAVVYRALINMSVPQGDPVVFYPTEMSWGVPTLVVPPQTLTIDPNAQPRLTWSAPTVSWWPTPA